SVAVVTENTDLKKLITAQVTMDTPISSSQVDEANQSMHKTQQMVSSSIPCLSRLDFSPVDDNGEWDVTVRELVRILYLSGSARGQREGGILAPSTIDYMYDHLLAASGPLSDASYSA